MNRDLIKRRLIEQNIFQEKNLIEREELKEYRKYLETSQIKAIIGPRRAGKTTLGFQLLKNKSFYYVNFDDEILSLLKQENLGLILDLLVEIFGKKEYIFLDEIQNIQGWELFVNRLHRLGYNIFITGSNSKLLSRELSTHLGGRALSLELMPFSFKDFLKAKNIDFLETDEGIALIKNTLLEYLKFGGFPEVILYLKDNEIIKKYYNEIFDTIVFKDIARRFKIKNIAELNSIASIVLNQFGTRLSFRKISKEVGLSIHTINKYLKYLDDSYLLLTAKKFSYKAREMELSFRKYYVIDTGLLSLKNFMIDFGRQMENLVAIELKRKGFDLFYYMYDKYEIDFIADKVIQVVDDNKEIPKRELNNGLKTAKELKKDLLIITWNMEKKENIDGIYIEYMPLWKFLLY
ncbi:MAG: ATP-binding protein [Candidatus Woesearchaeota archaeon]